MDTNVDTGLRAIGSELGRRHLDLTTEPLPRDFVVLLEHLVQGKDRIEDDDYPMPIATDDALGG